MSLTASEQRALARIERVLRTREPWLQSLFATFTSLTSREALPEREQLRRRAWRRWPITAAPLLVMLIAAIIVVGLIGGVSRNCGLGRAAITAPGRPATSSAGRWDRACPPQASYTP
jgi:Protein of unknown function (DUF3040)